MGNPHIALLLKHLLKIARALNLTTEPEAATVSQPAEAWAPTRNQDALRNKLCTWILLLFA